MTKNSAKKGPKTMVVEYLRVSGKGQLEGDGQTRQRKANERFARRYGYNIAGSFFDGGVSGVTEFEARDELRALFDFVRENGIKVCLVENASRISRELMAGEVILNRFRELGCQVIESASGVDLTNPEGDATKELIQRILSCVAEFQKKVDVAKLAEARARVRKVRGKCEGRKAYGEESEQERETIALMRKLRRKRSGRRMGYHSIAKELNERGIASRTGSQWHANAVRRILMRG
tara:strand:- start:16 stop:720 length:705 start_codon:yes stop_codon:yes gene_type:complete